MHYYSFHIKDYHAATAHLSNEEDLCYRRMLDLYYEQETPFSDPSLVARRVRFPVEVVNLILSEFFEADSGSWKHRRADREIRGFQAMKDASRRGAKARWNKELMPRGCPGDAQGNAPPMPTSNHEPVTSECPKDFSPDEASISFARKIGVDWEVEVQRFVDHHSLKGTLGKDWQAGFRKWISNGFAKKGKPSAQEAWRAAMC